LTGESPALPSVSRIKAAMDELPEPYRLILNLVLIEGLDYEEIAALTGKKEPTLRSLYSRGRSKLMKLLNDKI
jgi:RNA polymerase sigma-70 factor (ECF subfamily)